MPLDGQKWMINKVIEKVWGLIGPIFFPPRCPVCDEILTPEEIEKGIHNICKNKLYHISGSTCLHCGRPLENETAEYCLECRNKKYVPTSPQSNLKTISRSRIKNSHPTSTNTTSHNLGTSHITQAKALYLYCGAIKKTMYRFKYSNRREYAGYFAQEIVKYYGDWIVQRHIDLIVPVPMYEKKKRRRGYNQAETLTTQLSRILDIPVDTTMVRRIKDTTPQKELNDIERKNNLKNAFQIDKSIVQYSHILVVDDIYTTGSTAEAVAEEMIKIGVSQVYMMSVCIGKGM